MMPARHNEWGNVSDSQRRASDKYQKEHITQVTVKLNTRTDQDIIRFLWGIHNKQGLIKRLLRDEIGRTRNGTDLALTRSTGGRQV